MMFKTLLTVITLLMAVSAIGLLFFPSEMLAIVGMADIPTSIFLLRASGAGVTALLPSLWVARREITSPTNRAVLFGIALYLALSSAVDLLAYRQSLVNSASVPSMLLRTLLSLIMFLQIAKMNR